MIAINKIKPNKANPRVIKDEKFHKLCQSIKEFPKMLALRPIVIDADGTILGGNMRYKALLELGYKELQDDWVKRADELTDEEKQRFIIEDNVGFGDWDFDALSNEWDEVQLEDWGVDLPKDFESNSDKDIAEAKEDDFDETQEQIEQRVQSGDIWQLGEHRLMCGSSLDKATVLLLLDGQDAPLTFTDPPYRLATQGGGVLKTANSMKQIKDNGVDEFEPLKLQLYSKTNIYSHNKPLIKDYILLAEREKKAYDLCIYKKQGLPNYKGHMMTDIEYIAIIGEQGPKQGLDFETYSKVFVGNKDKDNDLSYSKPVALCAKFIKLYSDKGDTVLDLFGGSGSTLIACEQLGRRCRMMELDPHYCDVIIARFEKLTCKKAVKLQQNER